MVSAMLSNYIDGSTPSDERGKFDLENSAALENSGTSMASNYRKMRLQGQTSPTQEERKTASVSVKTPVRTPLKSPGGSVLARVQLFETNNAKVSGKSPSYHSSSSMNSFKSESKTSSSPTKTGSNPRSTLQIDMPKVERKLGRFQDIISDLGTIPPQLTDENLNARRVREKKIEQRETNKRNTFTASRRANQSHVPDFVDNSSGNAKTESNNALSERRRKMMMAKKYASNARAADSSSASAITTTNTKDSTSTTLAGKSQVSNSSSYAPDPLDREALRKQGNSKEPSTLTGTLSPNRRRKFKMVEASLKRSLQEEKDAFADSTKTESTSSVSGSSRSSVNTTDLSSDPGHIGGRSPDRNYTDSQFNDLGALPTINSQGSKQSDTVGNDYALSERTDHSQHSPYNEYDMNLQFRKEKQSPVGQSDTSSFNKAFHHMESEKDLFETETTVSIQQWNKSSLTEPQSHQGHFFAPITVQGSPNMSFDDNGDDETQFNSVSMQDTHDRKKAKDSITASSAVASPHSPGTGSDGSYFFHGGSRKSEESSSYRARMPGQHIDLGHQSISEYDAQRDDDAESYTDSITNGSWTGRMRAQKAIEQTVESERVDQRIDPRVSSVASHKSLGHSQDDGMSITDRVFSTVQKQQKAAMTDAKEGLNTFAKEDPNTTAIGLGIAGALCGAIAFGPLGILVGAASAGAGYKFSHMPEDERSQVKTKASSAMHKLHKSAVSANDTISNTCVSACGNGADADADTKEKSKADEKRLSRSIGSSYVPNIPVGSVKDQGRMSPKREPNPMGMSLKVSNLNPIPQQHAGPNQNGSDQIIHPTRARQIRRKLPACQRMGRITPVSQIHSLDPALHPRAWLDVMSSAWTSRDEKNEAMEEILLLSKDKVCILYCIELLSWIP